MFEVGKLCDESMDSLLGELEKVSLLDAEGEGEVSRYFQHAVCRFPSTKNFSSENNFVLFAGYIEVNNNCPTTCTWCWTGSSAIGVFGKFRHKNQRSSTREEIQVGLSFLNVMCGSFSYSL